MAKKDPVQAELDVVRMELKDTRRLVEEKTIFLNSFQNRLTDLGIRIQNKRFIRDQLEEARPDILRKISLNELSESAVLENTKEADVLKKEISDLEELLKTTTRTQSEVGSEVQKLGQKMLGVEHKFWFIASQIELKKVIAIEPIIRAWVCSNLSHVETTLGSFLTHRLKGVEGMDIEKVMRELKREYLPD